MFFKRFREWFCELLWVWYRRCSSVDSQNALPADAIANAVALAVAIEQAVRTGNAVDYNNLTATSSETFEMVLQAKRILLTQLERLESGRATRVTPARVAGNARRLFAAQARLDFAHARLCLREAKNYT